MEQAQLESVKVFRAGESDRTIANQIIDEYCNAVGVMVRDTASDFDKYFLSDSGIWLAELSGEVIGCVVLRPLPSVERACEVKRMYVKPSHRGKQVSHSLMHSLHEYATLFGYEWCYLDSKDDLQAAIKLYEKLGYEHCARYNDNPQATVFMRRRLMS